MSPLGLGAGYRLATDGELAQLWGLSFRAALGRVAALPGDGSAQVLLGDGVGDPVVCWPLAHLQVSVGADVWVAWFGGVPVIVGGLTGCTVDAATLGGLPASVYALRDHGHPTYVHEQPAPAAVWAIRHNLHSYPAVTVVDSAGATVWGEVRYVDADQVEVSFAAAFAGRAYLN